VTDSASSAGGADRAPAGAARAFTVDRPKLRREDEKKLMQAMRDRKINE
jgi:hypothetical protein